MSRNVKAHRALLLVGAITLLTGCSTLLSDDDGPPNRWLNWMHADPRNATPHDEPLSPYGNPSSYTVDGTTYRVLPSAHGYHKRGMASWYGRKFQGRLTSTHERYDPYKLTAASTELPIPCYVRVTNLDNGRQVTVRVNDRGPFHGHRLIDLSYAAAKRLRMLKHGTAPVDVRVVEPASGAPVLAPDASHQSIDVPANLDGAGTDGGGVWDPDPGPRVMHRHHHGQGGHKHRGSRIDMTTARQIGVFSEPTNAIALQQSLLATHPGARVAILRMRRDGQMFYRVMMDEHPPTAAGADRHA